MPKTPADEESWTGTLNPRQTFPRPFRLPAQSLVLSTRPANDIGINPLEGRTQLCPVEVAVVVEPATDVRIVRPGQLLQGLVTMTVKGPAPDGAALPPSLRDSHIF